MASGTTEEALAAYRRSLAIREKLAAADPGNTEWQRDLSVSHNKIGDVLLAAGRREEALAAYRRSLAIRETLAAADPGNTEWQRDLSVSHDKIGDVLMAAGRRDGGARGVPQEPRDPRDACRRRSRQYRSGSATCRSATTRSATCCWGRGSGRRRWPEHTAAPSRSRSSPGRSPQHAVAARPVGQPQQDRRRADGGGTAGRGAGGIPPGPRDRRDTRRHRSRQHGVAARTCGAIFPEEFGEELAAAGRREEALVVLRRKSRQSARSASPPILLTRSEQRELSSGLSGSATCWWRRGSGKRRWRNTARSSRLPKSFPPPMQATRYGRTTSRWVMRKSATC